MNEIQLHKQNLSIIEQAQEICVFNSDDNKLANALLSLVKNSQKAIKEFFKPEKDKAKELHKQIVAKEKTFLDPLVEAEGRIKSSIAKYLEEEREEREAQEREIRIEVEKKEKIRLAEIAKREEELRKAAGFLSPEQIAEEQRKIEEANRKEFMVEVKVEKEEAPKGQITKYNYSAEVVDFEKLPSQYKTANMPMLNGLARVQKETLNIPGVKVIKKLNISTRI